MKYIVEIARFPYRYEVSADSPEAAQVKAESEFASETNGASVYEIVSVEPQEA